jgi:hypothetical protein
MSLGSSCSAIELHPRSDGGYRNLWTEGKATAGAILHYRGAGSLTRPGGTSGSHRRWRPSSLRAATHEKRHCGHHCDSTRQLEPRHPFTEQEVTGPDTEDRCEVQKYGRG